MFKPKKSYPVKWAWAWLLMSQPSEAPTSARAGSSQVLLWGTVGGPFLPGWSTGWWILVIAPLPVDFWANDRSDTTAWFCLAGYLIFHIWEEEIIDFQFLGLAQSPSRTHIFWMGSIATRERYSLTVENPTFCQVWQRQICDAGPQILWPRPTILFDS